MCVNLSVWTWRLTVPCSNHLCIRLPAVFAHPLRSAPLPVCHSPAQSLVDGGERPHPPDPAASSSGIDLVPDSLLLRPVPVQSPCPSCPQRIIPSLCPTLNSSRPAVDAAGHSGRFARTYPVVVPRAAGVPVAHRSSERASVASTGAGEMSGDGEESGARRGCRSA